MVKGIHRLSWNESEAVSEWGHVPNGKAAGLAAEKDGTPQFTIS